MRSKLGLWASVVFFLAPPLAVVTDSVLGRNPSATAHLVWALGFALLAGALVTFDTPRWIAGLGCFAAGAAGLIFLLQGISDLVPNEILHRIAFPILGAIPERVFIDLLIASFVGLLLTDSRGRTRVLGWLVMPIVVGLEVAGLVTQLLGNPIYETVPALKLILLLPLVWLLCESVKKSGEPEPEPAPAPAPKSGSHRKQ
jgi:hypothetical protein